MIGIGKIIMVEVVDKDNGFVKMRPCLVVGTSTKLSFPMKIFVSYGTSQRTDTIQPWDLLIPEYRVDEMGLKKATVFDLQRTFAIQENRYRGTLGELPDDFAPEVEKAMEAVLKHGRR